MKIKIKMKQNIKINPNWRQKFALRHWRKDGAEFKKKNQPNLALTILLSDEGQMITNDKKSNIKVNLIGRQKFVLRPER